MKRLVALFLVLLLSIESFAAVVSDNDGSAFITKAEFDSLKNSFQAQIDQYNTSIDSKIDGAIASYLAGIQISKVEAPELVDWWNQVRWMDDLMIYSNQSLWTSQTAKTIKGLKWHRPNTSNRTEFQSGGLATIGIMTEENGITMTYRTSATVLVRSENYNTNIAPGRDSYGGNNFSEDHQSLIPTILKLHKDDSGNWVTYEGFTSAVNLNQLFIQAHKYSSCNNIPWRTGYTDKTIAHNTTSEGFKFLTPDSGYLFKLQIKTQITNPAYSDARNFTFIDQPDSKYIDFYMIYGSMPVGDAQSQIRGFANIKVTQEDRTMDWYESATDLNRDFQNLPYVLLGRSQTWEPNIAKALENSSTNRNRRDISTSPNVNFKFFNVNGGNFGWDYMIPQTNSHIGASINYNMNIPLWDKIKANEINSGKYYYDRLPIKLGQGMPLGEPATKTGKAKIKLQFEKKNVQTGADATFNKVTVKIKKNDFLSAGDYAVGDYNGTACTFNENLNLDTNVSYNFNIDVNKGDHLWMQISPLGGATDGNIYTGNYARITNLTMNYEYE